MSAERWRRLHQFFDEVVDLPTSQWEQKIEAFCGGDDQLRAEVRSLLAAAVTPNVFLDRPATTLLNPLRKGTLLTGRFELLAPLGQGGMGEVWRARDRQLGEDVAIKTVSQQRLGDAASLARFKREIQLARKVAHPNVCRVYDLFEDTTMSPPRVFLTMEFIEGRTLADRLRRTGPIGRDEALSIFGQIAAGVAAAHQVGVVHRDLKPANVMLAQAGGQTRAVVMDFGLARAPAADVSDGQTASGTLVGTPEYMAPEQIGGSSATPATDVYALGLILFELLSGARPYAGGTTFESWMRRAREAPRKLSGEIPGVQRRIDEVIAKCLDYEPAHRFRDAGEMWVSLQSPGPLVTGGARSVVTIAGVVIVIAVLAAAAVGLGRLLPHEPPPADAVKWNNDAQAALAEGASLRALNDVNRAIAAAPQFAAAHGTLAEVLLDLDMPGRAQEAMLKVMAAVPDRSRLPESDAAYVAAVQQLLVRNCDGAISSIQRFVQLADTSDRPVRLITVARMLERCDRPDDAVKALADAAALDGRNPAIPLRHARVLASRQKYDEAFAALTRAEGLFKDRTNFEGVGEVLTMRGTFQQQQDRLDVAEATLTRAGEVARSLEDVRQQVRVALQQAIVRRKRGDVAAANRLTTEALDLARRSALDTLTLQGLFALANVHLVSNEFAHARMLFEQALGIAEAYRHDEYRARAQLSLASVLIQVGELDAAFKSVEAARPYYARIGHRRNQAIADTLQGQIRLNRGQYRDAVTQFETAVQQARDAGDPEQETLARENLATALTGVGRLPDALAEYTRVLDAHTRTGRKRAAAYALLNVADIESRLGRFEDADRAVARASGEATSGAAALNARMHRVLADMALRRGRFSEAAREARAVMRVADLPSAQRAARARQNLCLAEAHLGRRHEAQQVCEPLLNDTPQEQTEVWLENRLTVAEARLLRGDLAGAEAAVSEAIPILRKLGGHHEHWRALALLAAARQARPDVAAAREELTRELRQLRLTWGEPSYSGWLRRTDVRALLAAGGVTGEEQ